MKSTTTTTRETQLERTTALGTTISGQTVSAQAGQDLLIKGSNVVSDNGTTLVASRDVKIENALDTSTFYENKQQVTKGLMGGGIGFTVGTRDQRPGHQAYSQTVVGSTVGSVNGDVTIVAGRDFAQVGSVIQTPKGDVDVLAQKISIQGAAQEGKDVQTTAFRQSGLTVAVSAPLLSALESTKDMAENVGEVGDARMQALGLAATAIKAKEAVQALQADPKAAGGLSVSITVGSSQSKSRTETTTTTNQGSEVTAGGDIRLTAQGAGKDSSIDVQGSDLAAAQRLAIKAEGDVSLTSSQDLVKQKSENSSSSASVGVAISVGSGGASMGFTASASLARGKADGEDVIQRNTHVQGKEVSIESGGDTTLKGAVVSGDKVKATVGGDLNIESLQDTSRFRSESMQAGGSVTVGAGFSGSASFGQSKVNSDFTSVVEQSGIRAGDGGFQVAVKGNTDLKGGSITSTQAAVDAGVNSFKSGSLTMSDIENKADYKGSSFSVAAGFGKKDGSEKNEGGEKPKDGSYQLMTMKPGDPGQSAGVGVVSEKAGSTTKAGISGVAGNSTARTGDAESGIKQIFDKEKVQQDLAAQVAVTQTFGKEAAKQIGEFAKEKLDEATVLRGKAVAAKDPVERDEYLAQAAQLEKNWGPDGALRVAAHTALGALTGNLDGAIGAAAGTLTAPNVKSALEAAGVDGSLVNGLTGLASTAVGGLTGGSAAGAATAFNEVTNNFLAHPQRQQLEALKKKSQNGGLSVDESRALVALEIADQMSDELLAKFSKGQALTKDQKNDLAFYAVAYTESKYGEAYRSLSPDAAMALAGQELRKLATNPPSPSYTYPYAGSNDAMAAWVNGTYPGGERVFAYLFGAAPQSTERDIFLAAKKDIGMVGDRQWNESRLPSAIARETAGAEIEPLRNSAYASAGYLIGHAAGYDKEDKDRIATILSIASDVFGTIGMPKQILEVQKGPVRVSSGGGRKDRSDPTTGESTRNGPPQSSTLELFTDERGPQVAGAKGVGPTDPTAVAADVRNMSSVLTGSQGRVVANNPLIPKSAGGTGNPMEYLPEVSRVVKSGGEIVINLNESNPTFRKFPSEAELSTLGLKVKYQGALLSEFSDMTFRRVDGSSIPKETMKTIVLVKD
ncbi:hemagglutinin repeat-containing protein [Mitsuaria sp. GD03876]|uniref:hemagglutinin repeat-containing protein n=1 Tax=Mitsuaria sp. GD03876 TaxID=2975399 RepID=UPI00244AC06A|nr:hemagglutinin repeat-containing protein [Mitsuaria sp. GD03876]MDH0864654.1 hemagglutinin repeat-containing protein [Mitsuaria sp. GD03876]